MSRRWERRRRAVAPAAVVAVLAVLVGGAVAAQGFDTQQTTRTETSVWVARDDGRYARVDTELDEIDTVRQVADPTQVLQHGSTAVVVADGRRTLWAVDAADPVDLSAKGETASGSTSAPEGATAVGSAGDWVVYRTDSGGVWAGRLDHAGVTQPTQLQPKPAAAAADARYVASAAAVDASGTVAVYASSEHAVRVLDAASGKLERGPETVASPPADDADLQMALIGGTWVLVDGTGTAWWEGHDGPVDIGTSDGALLQQSAAAGSAALVADDGGLVAVNLSGGSATRTVRATGIPARPVVLDDGTVVAAWLGTTGGSLWSSADGQVRAITVAPGSLDKAQQVEPSIASNGGRAVLVEQATGQLWSVPDGQPISSDEWAALDQSTTAVGTQQVDKVTEQLPPEALGDQFGVRAGTDARLPVLLNDSDPNTADVLTVVPETLTGLPDPAFGSVTLAEDDQLVVAHVSPGATGSATFTYQVTDGTASSAQVTVTLQVVDAATNRPPAWCPVVGCTQQWPTVDVAPGGTARVGLLDSWVDPDGDPFVLHGAAVDDPTAPVRVVVDSEGTLTVQHTDPNGASGTYHVTLTVGDSHGERTTRALEVRVAAAPTLVLEPVAVVVGPSWPGTVNVTDHVTSGSGSYRLLDAVATGATADQLTVVPDPKDGTIGVAAAAAGQYRLTYTVQDLVSGAQQTAVVRVRCTDVAGTLALAPMTAYVRDHEDTTVDVLAAVRSTTDHVLMVAAATSDAPALGVDVVDAALLRLRGGTAGGQPGAVGTVTVTVTDGANLTTTGTITVFLVAATTGLPPIAVPDAVIARVGTQVDVPVTANDVAAGGERLVVRDVVGSGAAGELAFASGSNVRYLAPTTPGTYVVTYVVALATDAEATAIASVTVTVLAAGTDRDPVPGPLEARVSVGGSVHIPVRGTGTDPDGDAVAVVSVTQPASGQGSAQVAAAGDAIVYQAPSTLTAGGRVSFTYTVRDPSGAEGTATVRVGVLAATSASVPVAYTDRVRVRAGSSSPVTVMPLLNDRDPSGGALTLVALRPDAPTTAGDAEAARLQALVEPSTSMADATVTLAAGDVLGAHAYVYTVESASGSTAEGLIVLEVVDTPVVEQPVVTDTVLTATDRGALTGPGVDVVSGAVAWTAGDVSGLHLSVWGDAAARYTARGGRIYGALPTGGELVPFALDGLDRAGQKVTAYGFLRIPAFDDMRVGLRAGLDPVRVDEGAAVDIDVSRLVDLASGDTLEVETSADHPVQRPAATCRSAGTTSVRYTAGNGAPWSDTCLVSVRISGQKTWTDLVVAIQVAPAEPQAVLTAVSRTVAPGTSQTIDLLTLVSWEGGRIGDPSSLVFTTGPGTSDIAVEQSGTTVTVTAAARAVPGARSTVQVRAAQYGGLTSSLDIVVGQAAQDGPRGATVTASCSVGSGGCSIQVVGVSGEYDPFAGKTDGGLTLDHVGDTSSGGCAVATVVAADARSVRVTGPGGAKPAGGTCRVPFTVTDAQGRLGAGLLDLDVLGYPAQPASLTLQAYTGTSVTVDIALGAAATAHPAVTGAAVYEGGTQLSDSCQLSGSAVYRCTVSGLTNGEKHELTARVRSSVGESDPTSSLSAWAYAAPSTVQLTARAVYDPARTTGTNGAVDLDLGAGDDVARFLLVDQGTGVQTPVDRTGATTTAHLGLSPGTHTIEVTPTSRYVPPSGATSGSGGAQTVVVEAAGSPRVTPGQVTVAGSTLTVSGADVDANGSSAATRLVYVLSRSGVVECRADARGGLADPAGDVVQASPTFTGLADDTRYWVTVCGSNGFGAAGGSPAPDGSVVFGTSAPTVTTGYSVGADPTRSGTTYSWLSVTAPVVTARPGMKVEYSADGGASWSTSFALDPHEVPRVQVRQCSRRFDLCSEAVDVPAASGSAAASVVVTASGSCSAETSPFTLSSGSPTGRATTSAAVDTQHGTVGWTLHWVDGGPYQGLKDLTTTCTLPAPPPTPTPTPTPTTAPTP